MCCLVCVGAWWERALTLRNLAPVCSLWSSKHVIDLSTSAWANDYSGNLFRELIRLREYKPSGKLSLPTYRMWTSFGCSCGRTWVPMIYEEGSVHMDQHVFDQWSISHAVWGFIVGRLTNAPTRVAAWKIGLLFILWELWENVVEVAFSTYAPGQYHGDSVVNSVFDMIPSMSGVWLGRHMPGAWPVMLLTEAMATQMGFGIHSVFLGHQGSICDVRKDPIGCGQTYVFKILMMPVLVRWAEGALWRYIVKDEEQSKLSSPSRDDDSPVFTRRGALATNECAITRTPEPEKLVKRRTPVGVDGPPPEFKL